MRHTSGSDRIVLALVGVLGIMVLAIGVHEIIAAINNSQAEIGANIATLMGVLGGTIAGGACGYVVGGKVEREPMELPPVTGAAAGAGSGGHFFDTSELEADIPEAPEGYVGVDPGIEGDEGPDYGADDEDWFDEEDEDADKKA